MRNWASESGSTLGWSWSQRPDSLARQAEMRILSAGEQSALSRKVSAAWCSSTRESMRCSDLSCFLPS